MMNRLLYLLCFSFFCLLSQTLLAQDTLPKFSVRNIGRDRIIVSWVNNFQQIKQISIQRSFDSIRNYKTILTVPDPTAPQNGYADTKAPNNHMFYRLFLMLDGGSFIFTQAKRPVLDTVATVANKEPAIAKDTQAVVIKPAAPPPVVKKPEFVPSFYVYTNKEGFVFINLPDADQKKYRIKFYEDDDTFLFEVKTIRQKALTLDKTNFYHAGWFRFELYDDEKLIERNKFYLAKDF